MRTCHGGCPAHYRPASACPAAHHAFCPSCSSTVRPPSRPLKHPNPPCTCSMPYAPHIFHPVSSQTPEGLTHGDLGTIVGMQSMIQQGKGTHLILFLSSSKVMQPAYFRDLSPHRIPVPQQRSASGKSLYSCRAYLNNYYAILAGTALCVQPAAVLDQLSVTGASPGLLALSRILACAQWK